MKNNIVWHQATVTRERRALLNGHLASAVWFTGLSGSGKSTLAHAVEERLHSLGCRTFVFDGDNVRHGLCSDLGFSVEDRSENLRRIAEMVKLFLDAGVISLCAFVSPMRDDRERVRAILGADNFLEIYCDCSLEMCEQRDVKGLYKKARAGIIKNYTGISAPYEEPEHPDLRLESGVATLADCVDMVIRLLQKRCLVSGDAGSLFASFSEKD